MGIQKHFDPHYNLGTTSDHFYFLEADSLAQWTFRNFNSFVKEFLFLTKSV